MGYWDYGRPVQMIISCKNPAHAKKELTRIKYFM
jgi:hypothetical protein